MLVKKRSREMRRFAVMLGMIVGLSSCSRLDVTDGVAVQHELTAEEESLKVLSRELAPAAKAAVEVMVATQGEVRELREKVLRFQEEFRPKWEALDAPVKQSQQKLEDAKAVLASELAVVRVPRLNERGGEVWCGSDGCGGATCSTRCAPSEVCFDDLCTCIPVCDGKVCGSDGCGGYCGTNNGKCANGLVCQENGTCAAMEYESVACTPSCYLKGSPQQAATQRAKPMRDFSPYSATAKAVVPASSEELDAWIKGLDGQRASVDAQVAELASLGAALEDAKKARDESKSAVAAATAADKQAQARAVAAKAKPNEFSDAVTAKSELDAAAANLKTNEATVADLTVKLAQSKSQSEVLAKALVRIKAEISRLTQALAAVKDAESKVSSAKAALEAAQAARDTAREELLKGDGATLAKLVADLTLATQSVLTADDIAYLGCSDDGECSVASLARADACRAKTTAAHCPSASGPSGLSARLNAAAVRRKKVATALLAAPETKTAREALDAALKVALIHMTALEPLGNSAAGDSEVVQALTRAASSRTTSGALTKPAVKSLEEALSALSESSFKAKVKAVIAAATAVPSSDELEHEVAALERLAVLVESVATAHANRAALLARAGGIRGLATESVGASAKVVPGSASKSVQ
jgi:prefoldin subunit 5